MRVPLGWLREHVPITLSVEDLAELMTMHGLPIERIVRPWEELSGVVVARVLEVRDHPGADRLCLARIDAGGQERQVVVGVRNMGTGDLVPYAPPGAILPGFDGPLERRDIRGVPSEGMLCSPKELAISADHERILVLGDGAEPGADVKEAVGLDEVVLDVEVLANRGDLLSIVGVAREVAAMTGGDLVRPDTSVEERPESGADAVTVEVSDPERCPRYLARAISEVAAGPSPLEAQVRLTAAGMRPRWNVVDATNYVMLELGQPLHAFDLRRLAGPGIVVRRAEEGERLVTLDGVERTFTGDDLLIADRERAVAVAGVIGGADTEVTEGTSDVLLESAVFEAASIFRTSRRLGMRTEASIRFDRGVDPEGVAAAAERAAVLIAQWAGGRVLEGSVDVGEAPPRRTAAVRSPRASMLLGVDLTQADVREALGRLRIPARDAEGEVVAEIPSYRVDVVQEVDLIEEVGRAVGYDRVPSSLPGIRQAGGLTREQRMRRRIADLLAGAGLWEVHSVPFASSADLAVVPPAERPPVRMGNPISGDDAYLQTGLLPGLLRAARRNVAHRRTSVRLFEIAVTFEAEATEPVEEERVAVLLTGPVGEGWPSERRGHDFLDVKGVLEHLLDGLGADGMALGEPAGPPWHPGRSVRVSVGGDPAGVVGELHPGVAARFDLPGGVSAFELRVGPLLAASGAEARYRDVSRFPPVHRDVAFVLDRQVPAGSVRAALVEAAGDLLDRAMLFDVFDGEPLPEGSRSLAFSLDFRAPDRTLTDDEVEERIRAIANRLAADFRAELRAG
ncbi:MAG: phenylalanine--tRNA ligase subunit beta [Actinomycetota bacterium]